MLHDITHVRMQVVDQEQPAHSDDVAGGLKEAVQLYVLDDKRADNSVPVFLPL